jgi:lysophospholipase L1-like esterase
LRSWCQRSTDALLHPKFVKDDRRRGRSAAQPFLEWFRGFELVRAIDDGIARHAAKAAQDGPFGEYRDRTAVAVPRYARNVRAMIRLARSFGAGTLVAPQPELFARSGSPPAKQEMRRKREKDGYGPYARAAWPQFVAAAMRVAAEEGVPSVDTVRAFDGSDETLFHDFVHFNDRGNELLAAHLAPALAKPLGLEPD